MAQKASFKFKEKEGKFFAPIVGRVTRKKIVNGAVVETMAPKAGIKGVYAMVRLELPMEDAMKRSELYAVSTEVFMSSR